MRLWAELMTSTHKHGRGLWIAWEMIHLLPRIGLVFYAYAWALEQVGRVKAMPRLPGARLSVGAMTGATPRLDQGCLSVVCSRQCTYMRQHPRICVGLFHRIASKLCSLLRKATARLGHAHLWTKIFESLDFDLAREEAVKPEKANAITRNNIN
ncbi:hypothetical protein PIB30_084927 [Stylosanthes scabra]|uniref:Uncharacterized protein n=1 Tax=Stylosanthes scabra TaxID=79078 RepID=A0ABU6TS84_9FABA|nr:hypothetical protein [Stylosanthes scabra]